MNDKDGLNVVRFKRKPWNEGRSVGQKPPLQPEHVSAIRTVLEENGKIRDLALFDLAIDSKLRGCDVLSLKVEDIAPYGCAIEQATVYKKNTGSPVKIEIADETRQSVNDYLRAAAKAPGEFLFEGRRGKDQCLTTRQYARLVSHWIESIGLDASVYGTQSLGRTKAATRQLQGAAENAPKDAGLNRNISGREAVSESEISADSKKSNMEATDEPLRAALEEMKEFVKTNELEDDTKADNNNAEYPNGETANVSVTTPKPEDGIKAGDKHNNHSKREVAKDSETMPKLKDDTNANDNHKNYLKGAAANEAGTPPKRNDDSKAHNNHEEYSKGEAAFSVRARLVGGLFVIGILILGGGGWAATAKLSGAIIAQGSIVVEKYVKKVQHLDGGIVAKLNVSNGDVVKAGDILMRLDDTRDRAEFGVIQSQITELVGRLARLFAERDGLATIKFSPEFYTMGPGAVRVRKGEIRLFGSNRKARESTKEQLRLRIGQHKNEIRALASQRNAKVDELKLIRKELEQVRTLYRKKLITVTRLYQLEREATRIDGERGGLQAQIARTKTQITEIALQILAVDQTMKRDAQREIGEIEAKIAEVTERKVVIVDRLGRVELRSPVSGIVHELAVHTVGGVVTPAQPVMLIVPAGEDLTIEARVLPNDIDQVVISQQVRVRLSAFNQRATSELHGRVVQVAADVTEDARSGQNYYLARIEIDKESLKKIVDWKLVPGMPVEVFMTTGERTALSYLAKPITDQLTRAFRDE